MTSAPLIPPAMKLQGILPPIATPFDYKGDLYKAKLKHNVERWNLTSLTGYVVGGSTGESVMLNTEERLTLWGWVAEYAASGKLLIAGTGAESVRESVWLANKAAEIGYQAALVITPHYYRKLMDCSGAQALYFRAVADQSKLPLVIYNFPQATGIDVPAETIVELSEHPNIIAVKESSGSVEKVAHMARGAKQGFQVLVGSAPVLLPSLAAGATGAILAYANAAPYSTITIWGSPPRQGDGGGPRMAGSHFACRASCNHEVRHPRSQVRHGP